MPFKRIKHERWSVVAMFIALASVLAQSQQPRLSKLTSARAITISDIVGVNRLTHPQISPDGAWVFYRIVKPLGNTEVFLVNTADKANSRQLNIDVRNSGGSMRWSPDSKTIAYLPTKSDDIRLISVRDLSERSLIKRGDLGAAFAAYEPGRISNLKWSPDGKSIAFILNARTKEVDEATPEKDRSAQGIEMDPEWQLEVNQPSISFLCLIHLEAGRISRITDKSLSVQVYDWSPDSSRLVFAANQERGELGTLGLDLFVVEIQGKTVSPLVRQDGAEFLPSWSPDGKWIAFLSQRGKADRSWSTWLSVVPAVGGEPKYLGNDFRRDSGAPSLSAQSPIFWSEDKKEIYFPCGFQMSHHLFRVPIGDGPVTKMTPDDQHYSWFSQSADRQTIVYVKQGVAQPAGLYISNSSFANTKKLADVNPQLSELVPPQVETLNWRSRDNRWDIHAVLIKPPDYRPGRRYPLIVFLEGGPDMVSTGYGLSRTFPALVFATRGYVVLVPNTRGRGGYGQGFERAMRDEKSWGIKPFEDVMSGAAKLIQEGIADPERMGLAGWSYGGYLAALGITQTNRFKAAWIGDIVFVDLGLRVMMEAGTTEGQVFSRDELGISSPHNPEAIRRLITESPIYHLRNVKTPTLLECGGRSPSSNHKSGACRTLFQGLRSINIPSELILYPDEGHGWSKPSQYEESFNRQLEWMDYWVRGIATGRMAKRYGPPKNAENTATAAKSQGN